MGRPQCFPKGKTIHLPLDGPGSYTSKQEGRKEKCTMFYFEMFSEHFSMFYTYNYLSGPKTGIMVHISKLHKIQKQLKHKFRNIFLLCKPTKEPTVVCICL